MFGLSSVVSYLTFIKSIGVGFFIALIYGLLIILRKILPERKTLVLIQDVLFCLVSSVISFIFIFDINGGTPRLFIFFGEAIGFFLFFLYKLPIR